MDRKSSGERDLEIDIESGQRIITNEQDASGETSSGVGHAKRLVNRVCSGFVGGDGSMNGEEALPSANGGALVGERFAAEEKVGLLEKGGAEKPKKKGRKKPPKPPRPPRPLSLDAADEKLIREITELEMLRRARIERMKALKKMKNAKSASSNNNFFALLITILFCFVILWQGLLPRSSSRVSFHGSPESSVETRAGLISIQFYKNTSTISQHSSSLASPNNAEPVSGMDDPREASRAAG